jgi:hypothetical protein
LNKAAEFPLALFRDAPHICIMTDRAPDATFDPVQLKDGSGWYVRLTLPDGREPQIDGFKTEAEAQDWIKSKSAEWLKSYEGGKYA